MRRLNSNDDCREPWHLWVHIMNCQSWGLDCTMTQSHWTPALIPTALPLLNPTLQIINTHLSYREKNRALKCECVSFFVCVGVCVLRLSVIADSCALLSSALFSDCSWMPARLDSAGWCKLYTDSHVCWWSQLHLIWNIKKFRELDRIRGEWWDIAAFAETKSICSGSLQIRDLWTGKKKSCLHTVEDMSSN